MKLLFTLLMLTQIGLAQVWIQLEDYPATKRDDGVAVTVNGKAYFGSGLIEWAAQIDFHALDLTNYTWSDIPNMPNTTERQYACAFAGANCFYVFGGTGVGGALNNMYKYDISTSSWTLASPKPGNGLSAAACMNFGDKVIFSGGKFQSGKVSDEVWEYTISTDAWLQKNNFPFAARWRASAAVLNNTGYLIFGLDTGNCYRKELYTYTPSSDTWAKLSDFPMAGRAYSSLNAVNNKLFLFAGHDTLGNYYKDSWYFNPASPTWMQGPDLPANGRRGGMSCAAGDKFFYSCGLSAMGRLTETWMTDVPVGLKENSKTSFFSVYPNPTNELLKFNVSQESTEIIDCYYSDISGRELGVLKNLKSDTELDLSLYTKGIYFLKFYSGNKLIEVKKIVKN